MDGSTVTSAGMVKLSATENVDHLQTLTIGGAVAVGVGRRHIGVGIGVAVAGSDSSSTIANKVMPTSRAAARCTANGGTLAIDATDSSSITRRGRRLRRGVGHRRGLIAAAPRRRRRFRRRHQQVSKTRSLAYVDDSTVSAMGQP